MSDNYNGWSNWDTWESYNWIGGTDENLYTMFDGKAQSIADDINNGYTDHDDGIEELADYINQNSQSFFHWYNTTDQHNYTIDVDNVDFEELAHSFIDEYLTAV